MNANGRYVTYYTLVEKYDAVYESATVKDGGTYSKACTELLNSALMYGLSSNILSVKYPHEKSYFDFLKNWEDAVVSATQELQNAKKTKKEPNAEKLLTASEYLKYLREVVSYEVENNNVLVKPVVSGDMFFTAPQVLLDRLSSLESKQIVLAYAKISDAINKKNLYLVKDDVDKIFDILRANKNIDLFKIYFENLFNNIDPFFVALLMFVVSFVLFLCSALKKDLELSASVFLCFGGVVYLLGIIARAYIQMRPPVTNFYSSVVFTGAVAVLFGTFMYFKRNSKLSALSAVFVGMLSLLVAVKLPYSGDTMGMMRAVLNSNFWLSAHVMTIMIGYCGLFLAGFTASFRLICNAFSKGNFGLETTKVADGIYLLLCVCLLFTFMGTMLGGIWADMSWGRFWGWDPKENGALMIVLWTSATIHCRALKICNDRFFLVLTGLGNVVVAWAWFGVNLLGVGLHSYGFIEGGWLWFIIYVVLQIFVAPFGLIVYKGNDITNKE